MLNFSLDQVQSQKLLLTPELKQSIQILQYSTLELEKFLYEQAVENPIIDIQWPNDPLLRRSGKMRGSSDNYDAIANLPGTDVTLEQWIITQLLMTHYTAEEYKIIVYFAGNLDESGYLTVGMEEVVQKLGLPLQTVEKSLTILQSFDPAGVGARTLQECLLLQIQRDEAAVPLAAEIVEHFLIELSRANLDKISRELEVAKSEVESALSYILRLNPRPCAQFGISGLEWLLVDAKLVINSQNEHQIQMKDMYAPKVTMNEHYLKLKSEAIGEIRGYFEDKVRSAQWLIRSIEHRNSTLQKVMTVIIEEQLEFFTNEEKSLKPMNLKAVSEKIGMHESTVSRAVRNKYMDTPRGIFELKYFFTSAIQTDSSNPLSSNAVKRKIKLLIEQENKNKPLSDQFITEILQKDGIQISRRTVAKYRDEERILPSSLRKCSQTNSS